MIPIHKLIYLSVLLTSLKVSVHSQDFSFVQLGKNEGLKHSQLLDISQDHNGNLWLGTATRSVYRFDGREFFEYKLYPSNYEGTLYTLRVRVDQANAVWILTNIGLLTFDGVTTQKVPIVGNLSIGIKSHLITDFHNDKWILDEKGVVFQLVNDTLTERKDITGLTESAIIGFVQEGNSVPMFYTADGKIVKPTDGISSEIEVESFKGVTDVKFISKEEDDYIVASSESIYAYDSLGERESTLVSGLAIEQLSHLIKDRDGVLWYIANNKLYTVNKDHLVKRVSGSTSLSENDVFGLFKDKDKAVWLSVDVQGLLKHRKQFWRKLEATKGVDITAMAEMPSGEVVFGSYNHGILGLDKPLLVGKPIACLTVDREGRLLVGTLRDGLFEVQNGIVKKLFPSTNQPLDVHGISTQGDSILIGTSEGVYILQGAQMHRFALGKNGSIPTSVPRKVNDTLYFAGSASGLLKIYGDSVMQANQHSLKNSTIYDIKKHKNGLFSIIGEFSSITLLNEKFKFISSLNLRSIVSNVLLFEMIDTDHWLVGSNDGLFKLGIRNDSLYTVKKFDKLDGYFNDELYVGSSLILDNGEIVVGTVDGAYMYNPTHGEDTSVPPITYITGVELPPSAQVSSLSGYFGLPVDLKLKYHQNDITFSFSGCSLSNPYSMQFQYMIEGLDSDWSPLNTSQKVTYASLPPGKYSFRVQAVSEGIVWGTVSSFPFEIEAAFWQTLPFYLFVIVFIALTVFTIIYHYSHAKVRKLKLMEELRIAESTRLRKQMAMDFHDEMGNRLASMLTQASLLKSKYSKNELVAYFDFFESNAHAIYHGTKDFIWSIDITSNNLLEVVAYLRDFGVTFFERNGIVFNVSMDILDKQFDVPLPEGHNRDIILIFKEVMTNSLKHGSCHNTFFSIQRNAANFVFTFEDDGIGIVNKKTGNGMRNMKLRASRIGASFTVENRANGGVIVELTYKLSKREISTI